MSKVIDGVVRRDLTKTEKIAVGHKGMKLSAYNYMLILLTGNHSEIGVLYLFLSVTFAKPS